MRTPTLRRAAAATLAAGALAALTNPAKATWSIVVVDTATGEVCAAAATCLENFNLVKDLPVVLVKEGVACSQGQIDFAAIHRLKIWNGFLDGDKPGTILQTLLDEGTSVNIRQWGIVGFDGNPVTWSGPGLGLAYDGVAGKEGTLKYAIQGNVITGSEVIDAARAALISTQGDLTQRVMAAMEAARAMGGDGRCSCDAVNPPSCGAPPPAFEKSAHCAFLVSARQGDTDGQCYWAAGCATGDYYVKLHNTGDWDDPDPVLTLQADYDAWRAGLAGRPDHLRSTMAPETTLLVADGATSTDVLLELIDLDGVPLAHGGATITVEPEEGDPLATATDVVDHGDGTYTLRMTAGTEPGVQRYLVRADDGVEVATLYPFLELEIAPFTSLFAGAPSVSASAGGDVPFVVNLGAESAGDPFVLLASASGSAPGLDLGGVLLPLNPDGLTSATLFAAGGAVLPGTLGALDDTGRAEAGFAPPPGLLAPLFGAELTWAALEFGGAYAASAPATLAVTP
jgi:hypothetical protein